MFGFDLRQAQAGIGPALYRLAEGLIEVMDEVTTSSAKPFAADRKAMANGRDQDPDAFARSLR